MAGKSPRQTDQDEANKGFLGWLRTLIPSRGMVFVLIVITLALFWYISKANQQADHLFRRNFNYLNQVASNINASLDAAIEAVQFNSPKVQQCIADDVRKYRALTPPEDDASLVLRSARQCVARIKKNLVDSGTLVSKPGDILITLERSRDFSAFGPTRRDKVNNLLCNSCSDRGWFPLSSVYATSFTKVRGEITPGYITSKFQMQVLHPVAAGAEPLRELRTLEYLFKDGGDQSDQAASVLLITFELNIPYEKVRGVGSSESFLDAVLLAQSDGSESKVIFSNTQVPLDLAETDMRELLRARSGFERFNSIREFEVRHGQSISLLNTLDDQPGDQIRFTQSALVPINIGGFNHLAFVQPFMSEYIDEDNLVLLGVVGDSKFNKLKYAIPFNWISLALLLLTLGVLSLNFFRLKLIADRGVIFRTDTVLGLYSLMGISALCIVYLVHQGGSSEFEDLFASDLGIIHRWIEKDFQDEVETKAQALREAGRYLRDTAKPCLCPDAFVRKQAPKRWSCVASAAPKDFKENRPGKELWCETPSTPGLSSMYLLNRKGRQVEAYASTLIVHPRMGFNVSSRDYFSSHLRGENWIYYAEDEFGSATRKFPFYLERIESKASGALETAISVPLEDLAPEQLEDDNTPYLSVGLTMLQSLENVVLPPGFGLAVFENQTGQVLFHSEMKRSLRENFYRATDDNADLKATVMTRGDADLNLDYKGESVRARVTTLANTNWVLVTYYRESLVDVVNFHFGINSLVLSASYIVIWLILAPLVAIAVLFMLMRVVLSGFRAIKRLPPPEREFWLPPQWLFPQVDKLREYRWLALFLLAVVVFNLWVLYNRDLPEAKYWVIASLIIVPLSWFVLLKGWSNTFQTMGSQSRKFYTCPEADQLSGDRRRRVRSTYLWYRINAVLVVLTVAVLPSMLLQNENYDLHERLWVEYYNWSVGERLQARASHHKHYLRRMNTPAGVEASDKKLRGVYLPRTEVYTVRGEIADCEGSLPEDVEVDMLRRREPPREIDALSALAVSRGIVKEGERLNAQQCKELKKEACRPDSDYLEQTQYLQLVPLAKDAARKCHVIPGPDGVATIHKVEPKPLRRQSDYMRGLLSWLPNVDDVGTVIESFIETEANSRKTPGSGSGSAEDPLADRRYNTEKRDADSGTLYVFHAFFPHTRSIHPWDRVKDYITLAIISALIAYLFHGFLVRRFLNRELEENIPSILCHFTADSIRAGGIVVTPPGMKASTAFARFVDLAELQNEDAEIPSEVAGVTVFPQSKLLVVKDFVGLIGRRQSAQRALSLIEEHRGRGGKVVILSAIDVQHWIYHQDFAPDITEEEVADWEALAASLRSYILPNEAEKAGDPDSRPDLLPGDSYRRSWDLCSHDEKMVLAGLRYESVVNPRNSYTIKALLRRRLVAFRNGHLEYNDPGWYDYVAGRLDRIEFRREASRYKNNLWIAFRGPMLLVLLVLVLFIAYAAQDELRFAFSLLGTVGAGAATLSTLNARLRELRGG